MSTLVATIEDLCPASLENLSLWVLNNYVKNKVQYINKYGQNLIV
ncbi:MAG: hypothetical protein K0R76_1551 [Alphaproteobacteria bacterium]|jgi:hypothetical protein|nr:hypothetical protein [Alphaproteobacteria bacterium]